ncbi:urea carboxylase-associated family protein [Streptomyces rapamycinicus NRRL 5491]|nr:urea carboxylase-associated family protein [Streptomyces rapamycinicus]UTP28203.1 urea carboxylase-associated family protein [Streptomyces rapamycinicus NRRL 5491]
MCITIGDAACRCRSEGICGGAPTVPGEHLSMEHTRTALERLVPRPGDALVSNYRRPLVRLAEDTSPGIHDTLIAACDPERYRSLTAGDDHANCADNMRAALAAVGEAPPPVPPPLNLFMHVAWNADGDLSWLPAPARPGDAVVLEALVPIWLVLSACPMDINAINRYSPRDVDVERIRSTAAQATG